jgi:NADPH-dependent ferric siderophore reductase
MATPPTPSSKPRRRFRPVEVTAVRPLTPRMVSVALSGPALADFEITAPTQHVKLLFPAPGQTAPALPESGPDGLRFPDDQPRPVMRTFTPRRFHPGTATLEVEFVLHGEGPASVWAQQAEVGQGLAVAGPGGRMPLTLGQGRFIVAGDESAIPAVATLLAALPSSASTEVYLEVDDATDEIELSSEATTSVTWLHRRPGTYGQALHDAVVDTDGKNAAGVWVACEAQAVRRIRRTLLTEGLVDPDTLVTRGYWRLGQENHPDHDYGEDAA